MSMAYTIKSRMNVMSIIVFVPCLLFVSGNVVFAEPYLMLDAHPSEYVGPPEESIVITDPVFTLYALVNSESGNAPDAFAEDPVIVEDVGLFYISAAIVPSMDETDPPLDLGSFTFDGELINVVSDMDYGSPPINAVLTPEQIAAHGIYNTYFEVFDFELDLSKKAILYDSMVTPDGLVPDSEGTLYYMDFNVDVSDLAPGYEVHFDLFTQNLDGSIKQFAPFSHDAVTPTPGALLLGSIGIGMVIARCRKRKTLIES